MIVHITEQFHDHEEKNYFIDSEKLDKDSPIDEMILQAIKKKAYFQDIHIYVDEYRDKNPDSMFWEEPEISVSPMRKKKGITPDKHVKVTIDFDC